MTDFGVIRRWIHAQTRKQGRLHAFATDDRVYVAILALAVVSGILSGVYG